MSRASNLRTPLTYATAASLAVALSGCNGAYPKPRSLTVGQLAALLKNPNPPKLYDANGDRTRREYGVIPGATLLPSSRSYALDVLPRDKSTELVFYCASVWCGAAETAAGRALAAGYSAVSVLPDGIKGWREAGMPTNKPN